MTLQQTTPQEYPAPAARAWYALYTRPRFEKKIDQDLKQKRLQSFLPLQIVSRVWSDRIKKIEAPLFPSYVFVHADRSERYLALQSTGVVRMVSFNGEPVRIPDSQIEAVSRILKHGLQVQPTQYLKFGDTVEVTAGPLQGVQGYFIEERGSGKLAVSVHAIQQSLIVQIDRNLIKKIGSSVKLA